jgi:hypothetical protein
VKISVYEGCPLVNLCSLQEKGISDGKIYRHQKTP